MKNNSASVARKCSAEEAKDVRVGVQPWKSSAWVGSASIRAVLQVPTVAIFTEMLTKSAGGADAQGDPSRPRHTSIR